MIRRASIPAARPPPRPRPRRRAARRRLPAPAAPAARRSGRRASAARQPLEPVVLGPDPHRGVRGHEGGEHRHQRHFVAPVLIERFDPAQVVEPLRREPGLLLAARAAPPRPASPPPRCGRAPSPTSPDSGRPRRAPEHEALEAAPAPRSTYTSTSETRIAVTAATARTRRAARSRAAATSRDGTARRSRSPARPAWETRARTPRCRARRRPGSPAGW